MPNRVLPVVAVEREYFHILLSIYHTLHFTKHTHTHAHADKDPFEVLIISGSRVSLGTLLSLSSFVCARLRQTWGLNRGFSFCKRIGLGETRAEQSVCPSSSPPARLSSNIQWCLVGSYTEVRSISFAPVFHPSIVLFIQAERAFLVPFASVQTHPKVFFFFTF